jgi:hypothetical protein
MPELDQTRDADQDDEAYLADAYAALDDDQRQKDAESATEAPANAPPGATGSAADLAGAAL